MGFLDKLKRQGDRAVDQHGEKVARRHRQGRRTWSTRRPRASYTDKIETGRDKAKDALDKLDGKNDGDLGSRRRPGRASASPGRRHPSGAIGGAARPAPQPAAARSETSTDDDRPDTPRAERPASRRGTEAGPGRRAGRRHGHPAEPTGPRVEPEAATRGPGSTSRRPLHRGRPRRPGRQSQRCTEDQPEEPGLPDEPDEPEPRRVDEPEGTGDADVRDTGPSTSASGARGRRRTSPSSRGRAGVIDRFVVVPASYVFLLREGRPGRRCCCSTARTPATWTTTGRPPPRVTSSAARRRTTRRTARRSRSSASTDAGPATSSSRCSAPSSADPIDERIDFFFTARSWSGEPTHRRAGEVRRAALVSARRPARPGRTARAACVGRGAAGYHRRVHDVRIPR